ncbi:hypothetical protein AKJ64_03825 [candidate division MSBL1 archaeon SCGC-AAA259E17]|uniref:Probable ribosomal RNA small subunit methyltransferase A n=1 Tax=candidate division MSBL1 archaeon SCGC-AAA259E17 TaxID=1698263 RepID=A0A133UDC5_9EURY|nr:hypothetical protein AKJ64_03825 [candidate division MSBL1 archaeon SCGC-AAA259E17]
MLREKTKKIIEKYDLELKKNLGQSHLVEEEILKRMIDYADISLGDIVLEIGSGLGNLTELLIERAGKVIAIEKDARLADILVNRLDDVENLEVVREDILEIELPKFDKAVANLPYSISSPFTFKLVESGFDLGVFTYQKEFAQRMVAPPSTKNYSRLSVNLSYLAQVELLEEVPPDAFIPQPEVWSSVVKIRPREPAFEVKDEELFFRVVQGAFRHRRKKIKNSLFYSFEEIIPNSGLSKEQKRDFIDEAISEELANSRPDNISPEDFGEISNCLYREFSRISEK